MKKILMIALISSAALFAAPISISGKASDIDVKVKTDKDVLVGQNNFVINLAKGGKPLTPKSVKIKAFMPEMPGMPEMGDEIEAKGKNGIYHASLNISMGGTWQITVIVVDMDGKTKRYKTSVNF
jgi:hypothetical protein